MTPRTLDNVFDAHPHGWAESNDVLCWVKHAGASSRTRFAGFEAQHLIPKDNISLVEMRPEVLTESLILAQDERWRRA